MKLNELRRPGGNKRAGKRVGRGIGSGKGKTSGRGTKGAGARSGNKDKVWFEGGQMPMNRRLPKRGFHNPFSVSYQIVNLRDLERLGDVTAVDAAGLREHGLIRHADRPVKLLGEGAVGRAYTIKVDKASRTAVAAIEAAGGSVEVAAQPQQARR
jgi:large subunit ribosomal protein L15